jgi:sortase A
MKETMRRPRFWIGAALLVVGVALLATWVSWKIEGRVSQAELGHRLQSLGTPRNAGAAGLFQASATRREASQSGMVGRLEMERIGLSVMMVEGISSRMLRRGAGHIPDTPFPGEPGNVGIAAHRDTYFRKLEQVARGDRVRLVTPDGSFTYEVDSILIVPPDRGDLLGPTDGSVLTLVTCYPFRWIGPAPKRFVVQARLTEANKPGTRTVPSS